MNKILSAIMTLLLVAGCQRVVGDVSSFSVLSANTSGSTYYFLPSQEQESSVEYSSYTNAISRHLSKAGWYRVGNPSDAEYFVMIDYGVAGSSVETSSVPIMGQTGGGTTTFSGSYNTYGSSSTYGSFSGSAYQMPTYGIVGSQTISTRMYQRYFQMKVIRKSTEDAVFEATTASSGTSGTFGQVADCIFDITLSDFPMQKSGKQQVLMDNCGQ